MMEWNGNGAVRNRVWDAISDLVHWIMLKRRCRIECRLWRETKYTVNEMSSGVHVQQRECIQTECPYKTRRHQPIGDMNGTFGLGQLNAVINAFSSLYFSDITDCAHQVCQYK